MGLFYGGLECWEINFAHGALVNDGIDVVTIIVGIVSHEVLCRRADSVALHPLDVAYGELRSEIRIFAHIFEVPAVHGRAIDVEGRSEHEMHTLGAGIACDLGSHFRSERGIPGRRERNSAGHGGGRPAVADSDGAVSHAQ